MRLQIFGAGGMGREAADIVHIGGDALDDVVFVTSDGGPDIDRRRVIAEQDVSPDVEMVVAIGSPERRRLVVERLPTVQRYGRLVSTRASISPSVVLADGVIICDFASVNAGVRIGRHSIVNCHAQVSHDCIIHDYVTISPHVSCNGWVEIGEGAFIGAGAILRNGSSQQRLMIGEGATIGMGAVVTKDVAAGRTVVGVPAQVTTDPILGGAG